MNSPMSALAAQDHHYSRHSSLSSSNTYASPQQYMICICGAPPNKAYLEPIIGCANKCRPKWFHLRCVGLTHLPYNGAPWYCPSCQIERGIEYGADSICVCDEAPYTFGPTIECAKRDDCATRWFHLPCLGDMHVESGEWYCPDCAVDMVDEQEQEQEVGDSHLEEQRNDVMVDFSGDSEMPDANEEVERAEWASDGIPGVSLGEGAHLGRQSPELDLQAPTGSALDVQLAEDVPIVLTTPEEESIEHISLASPVLRAQSAPAQLEFTEGVTQPANTPPMSRQSTPQASHEPEISTPSEGDTPVVLPDIGEGSPLILPGADEEEAPVILSGVDEQTPNILPTTSGEVPAILPATSEDVPVQEAAPDVEEAGHHEEQKQHLCLPGCDVDDNTGPMVACDGDCAGQWYHYSCVGLTAKPKSNREWYCPDCRVQRRNAKKRSQQGQPATQPSRSRRATRKTAEPEYCTCGTPGNNDMIACDANCAKQWFHFVCVGLTAQTVPDGAWYCDECRMEQERKDKRKGKKKAVRRRA